MKDQGPQPVSGEWFLEVQRVLYDIYKTNFTTGLDPDIKINVNGNVQETTYTFGRSYVITEEYRKMIADAYNEIANQLNIIGPIVFP